MPEKSMTSEGERKFLAGRAGTALDQSPAGELKEAVELPKTEAPRSVSPSASPRGAGLPRPRFRFGIRMKVLTLVGLSALVPPLLVGGVSYVTARDILLEKATSELMRRAAACTNQFSAWIEERSYDARVFATSFVVSENLERWLQAQSAGDRPSAAEAQSKLREYLGLVRGRYALYRELILLDLQKNVVASTGLPPDEEQEDGARAELVAREAETYLKLSGKQLLIYVRHPVLGRRDREVGTLVTVAYLAELWQRLLGESEEGLEEMRLIDEAGRPLFDSRSDPPALDRDLASQGVQLCLAGGSGVAEYRDGRGRAVLGAYRFLAQHRLGLLIEIDRDRAFAAVHRSRNLTILISLLAAGLMTAVGYGLVVGLIRPVESLIAGAEALSEGDLSREIPVSSRDEIGYLTQVFNQMTRALRDSHAELERMSITDELTGLFNRRYLARVFSLELLRAKRQGTPLSVLMIDIDHFKAFNDRLGHPQGDALLREMGSFLSRSLRRTDIVARYGGEEFVALLPDTAKKQAGRKAESLRKQVAEVRLADEKTASVTISVGVACWPEDGAAEQELVESADAALYEAKRLGRNRVALKSGGSSPG